MNYETVSEARLALVEIAPGVRVPQKAWSREAQQVLTPEAIEMLAQLHRKFNGERIKLLAERRLRQEQFDRGEVPSYLDPESPAAAGEWRVAPIPADLLRRRVEITGPVNSPKMVINMLSRTADGSRADCAMLDFEDSMKPSWENVVSGVQNVIGAAAGTLSFVESSKRPEKVYKLDPSDMAVVMVRCRGLHLFESNFLVDGDPISAGLFDLGLCFFHTANTLIAQKKTPKYYVPKCEHYLEARWWSNLFSAIEQHVGVAHGTLRSTFLIETLPAAYQIEEILYEIRDYAAGLNVGRWDKIFSDIKTLRAHRERVMADRSFIDMEKPWMKNYALRLIEICHRRGAFAMGGMAAFTPGREPEVREAQVAKVRADKALESSLGHDGCWVSHPYFIASAMAEFPNDNQLDRFTELSDKYPELLPEAVGPKTEAGLRKNIRVGIAYLHGWINDIGCVAWDNLMEDLATLEISRAQVWQWLKHQVVLDDGTPVTTKLVSKLFEEEFARIMNELDLNPRETEMWARARKESEELFLKEEFQEFLCFVSEREA